MNITDVAKAGYNAYGANRNFTAYDGKPMPSWDDLPEGIKRAWECATCAILDFRENAWEPEGKYE
jgi:hypothetical protein